MKDLIPEPQRLLESAFTEHTAAAERRAITLLRGLGEPGALSPQLLLRIKARIAGGAPRRVGTLRIKVLLATAILIAASGLVFAAQGWWQAAPRTQPILVPSGSGAHPSADAVRLPLPTPAPLPVPVPATAETPETPLAALVPAAQRASEKPKTSAHSPVDPVAALHESRLLSEALVELRRNNDPRAALTILDQYRERFPNGSLALEAARARAEALIALGQRAAALRVLDDLSPAALGRSMLLVRGELRAELNRCSDALADLSSALSQNLHDSVDERALFGRATCRSRGGDQTGARSDLNLYAARFPHGRFQVQVLRALQK